MDYFAVGGRPFLSQFPPHVQGIFKLARFEQDASGQAVYSDTGGAASQHELAAASSGAAAGPTLPLMAGQTNAVSSTGPTMAFSPADREPADRPPAPGQRAVATLPPAPCPLHQGFDPANVGVWDSDRFRMVKKLQDATRNRGMVHLMHDNEAGVDVAVKQMPNGWFRNSHQEFVAEHPTETEMPWQDIGCVNFLNQAGYAHACTLLGVFKDTDFTYVVTSFASEGDMFSWCESGVPPGPERETVVRPLARQMLEGVQQLHEMGIGHLDLSLENILMCKADDGSLSIRIIDFGMATNSRYLKNCVRGKASYQAPELHTSQRYDACLSDAFSLGVTLYAILVKDYPWLSTRPGGCKCFEYVRKHGFRPYLDKRKLRNSQLRVGEVMSEPLKQLLEGLLALDPAQRLTLGEASWASSAGASASRGSVWDEPWMHDQQGAL